LWQPLATHVPQAAYNLTNKDTGLLGDVSDPYVVVRLGNQVRDLFFGTLELWYFLGLFWDYFGICVNFYVD
jgi:hypothetical protein